MDDGLKAVWNRFFERRNKELWDRFPGMYRAVVTETNDPLNMRRVRIRMPALHDQNIKDNDCPWACAADAFGGPRCGSWVSPCKGDYVWVMFENGHPYAPVWTGAATPTRRKMYAYPWIHSQTPIPVNDKGEKEDSAPQDFEEDYLPADGRPMSTGTQDRYGNLDIISAVGFFPKEHEEEPPDPDYDALQDSQFKQGHAAPKVNEPDIKYMARVTKYGNIHSMNDIGYHWQKTDDDPTKGEFTGDFAEDEEFEIARWKYVQRLLNEDSTTGDIRGVKELTRYGHLFEMRDTGWAQPGPKESKSRDGEYGGPVFLSNEDTNDMRWIKIRTKGGFLWQMIDIGFDPQEDEYIKRKLVDEVGFNTEHEDEHWAGKDARQFRVVSRHGFKFVISDAESDTKDAFGKETPRGKGILIKGRRTGGRYAEGDQRGFFWEFNETEDANHTVWGTPLGIVTELNDDKQYAIMCSRLDKFSTEWKNVKENEFLTESTRTRQAELSTHHLLIDHANERIRLKTRGGKGEAPFGEIHNKNIATAQQGFEAHDGEQGEGPWVEVVDTDTRGFWFSNKQKLGIWRAKVGKDMSVWLNDGDSNQIVIRNAEDGKIQIYCRESIEIIGGNINITSADTTIINASEKLILGGGQARMQIGPNDISTNGVEFHAATLRAYFPYAEPGGGAGVNSSINVDVGSSPTPTPKPTKAEPTDRGATYNG